MINIEFDLFPDGKRRAVTFGYDDGADYDLRLIDRLDRAGAKCTLNLCSGLIGGSGRLTKEDVKRISERHEIASHAYFHPYMEQLPRDLIISEVYEDKKFLEDITGKPVIGMAYPYGTHDPELVAALKACGIKYGRTAANTGWFDHPADFMLWNPTCRHDNSVPLAEKFIALESFATLPVFFVWGHSRDYERNGNWHVLDELLAVLASADDIWYATHGELYDYLSAVKALRCTLDRKHVYNPSAITVYATVNGAPTAFPPATLTHLPV